MALACGRRRDASRVAQGRRLTRVRIRVPHAKGSARTLVRVERDEEDFLLSPLLGSGRLCERCWLTRRAATRDPSILAPGASCSGDLIAAFEMDVAASGRPLEQAQRTSLAASIRERVREARSMAQPESPATLLRVTPSGAVVAETVLPLPECESCLADARAASKPSLAHAVGRAAGIVAELATVPPRPAELGFPHVVTTRLSNSRLEPARPAWRGASGKGESGANAVFSALGESLERYAAEIVPQGRLLRARVGQLDDAVHPSHLTGMGGLQARANALDPESETTWVQAQSVVEPACRRWVPASSVYLASPISLGAPVTTVATSNGLAAAVGLDDAIKRAYAEVLERHAFFRVWYGLDEAPVPDATTSLDEVLRQQFEMSGLALRASVIACVDGVCVASASCWPLRSSPSRPGFALGLGNGTSTEGALRSAVLELAQVYRGLSWAMVNGAMRERMWQLRGAPQDIAEPYDHALLHAACGVERVPAPFGKGRRTAPSQPAPSTSLDQALFVDLTPPDIANACGLRVARVVVPNAVPLHFGCRMVPRRILGLPDTEEAAPTALLHPLS